jgi:hypothetical protein
MRGNRGGDESSTVRERKESWREREREKPTENALRDVGEVEVIFALTISAFVAGYFRSNRLEDTLHVSLHSLCYPLIE